MAKKSAGVILYRFKNNILQFLLVHPGGPYWAKKDLATWSIPKGEFESDEVPLEAAKRELLEETGIVAEGPFLELIPVKQKSGKIIYVWAVQQEADTQQIISNSFEMEWPPNSGKRQQFPEVDRAEWFSADEAKQKIVPGQVAILEELETRLNLV